MDDKFGRELMRGSLDLMVLRVLADGRQYGYLIQKRIREASGNLVKADAGTLYPLLHRLEADKLIGSAWDDSTGRKRKWYKLTPAGQKALEQQSHQWRRYVDCITRLLGGEANQPQTT